MSMTTRSAPRARTFEPRLLTLSALSAALALAAFAAQAQTAPPGIGDALRQLPAPAPRPDTAPPLPTLGNLPPAPPMQALPGGGPRVQVARFEIAGNREIDTATLQAQLQGEAGKAYTLAELEALAARLTRYYRGRGYFVARVYVPAQEPAQEAGGGVLTLRVLEGNYGRFVLDNRSRVNDAVVQGLLDDVKRYDIVSLDTLERAMLIINDTPGVQVVRADVMPGARVGTSDFAVGTQATPAANGYLLADNHGSRYTGKARLSGAVDWNSPTGRGDRLSASGLLTEHAGLANGRLAYSALLSTRGTRAEAALSRTRYELGDRYAALDATGTADALELNLTTPLKRTRATSIEAGLALAARQLRDEVRSAGLVTPKRSHGVTASVSLRHIHALLAGHDGQTTASAALSYGRLAFRDATARALDAAGDRTEGDYGKLELRLAHAVQLPQGVTAQASARAQITLSGRNLDGSERMGVAGSGGVLAYPIGELSGDHAVLLHAELNKALGGTQSGGQGSRLRWTAGVFTDHGRARAAHPAGPSGQPRTLADVGASLSLATTGGGMAKLQLARRTAGGEPVSERAGRTRVLVQGGWVF
ncbi:MAG: ShlB/FhaC/HecB family hemolysin secretion/activation protein [Roseateles sp.]|uniref:ShlB/FhaC/HecB family hemolysin secretion/activation protein n=1 Tax=Roseateles sp. TaxID=1971397 RepID=UPI0039EAA786